MVFSTSGKNARTTQVFINYRNNAALDPQGFAPFGEVVEGMDAVDTINPEYREQANQQPNYTNRASRLAPEHTIPKM